MGCIRERLLVLGARGWLGGRIAEHFLALRSDADIADPDAVTRAIADAGAEVVINAAAKTGRPNTAACDADPASRAATFRSNAVGAGVVARACWDVGVRLVHLSTTYVFEQTLPVEDGFTEDDEPTSTCSAMSAYARSKLEGEVLALRNALPGALVLRINLPIDGMPHERNFITRLAGYRTVQDMRHSVTTVPTMLSVMGSLISRGASGIYHVVHADTVTNGQLVGWYRELVDPMHHAAVVEPDPGAVPGIVVRPARLIDQGIWSGRTEPAVRDCLRHYARALNRR